jgi:hypothetical protein
MRRRLWISASATASLLVVAALALPLGASSSPLRRAAPGALPPPPPPPACQPGAIPTRVPQPCLAKGGGSGVARGDFNGDGFGDLAVGVPYENVGAGNTNGGAVNVIYGSATGLTSTGNEFWYQGSPGVAGVPEDFDHFGFALASGDFDGNSQYSDLAIGVPGEDIGSIHDAGLVQILKGGSGGLSALRSWDLSQATAGDWTPCTDCQLGAALAWGDFNHGAGGDIAIGMPGFELPLLTHTPGSISAGAVAVLYHGPSGLSTLGHQLWAWDCGILCPLRDPRLSRLPTGGRLGESLAAGDVDGDGTDDVAIGTWDHVCVVRGSGDGLLESRTRAFQPGSGNVPGSFQSDDAFGASLAISKSHRLLIGAPLRYLVVPTYPGFKSEAGAVWDIDYSGQGRIWTQSELPSATPEDRDHFGWSLASADFDGDGKADLAIGVPGEDVGSISNTGIVQVLYGTSSGFSASGAQIWHQDSTGVPGSAEIGDAFGFSVSAWNYGNGSQADLAIGVPYEDVLNTGSTRHNAGAVELLYGSPSPSKLTATGSQIWTQASPGMLDTADTDDLFGYALY